MEGDRAARALAAGGGERPGSEALAPVLRQINAAHHTAFALGERFAWGGQGAVQLRDAAGAGYVLKWRPGETSPGALPAEVRLLDRLRAACYPIPRYVAWGVLAAPAGRYTVQERLPGASAWGLRGAALEDALALNDLQADAGAALEAFARGAAPRRMSPGTPAARGWRARAATASASWTRCGPTRPRRRRSWRARRRTASTRARSRTSAGPDSRDGGVRTRSRGETRAPSSTASRPARRWRRAGASRSAASVSARHSCSAAARPHRRDELGHRRRPRQEHLVRQEPPRGAVEERARAVRRGPRPGRQEGPQLGLRGGEVAVAVDTADLPGVRVGRHRPLGVGPEAGRLGQAHLAGDVGDDLLGDRQRVGEEGAQEPYRPELHREPEPVAVPPRPGSPAVYPPVVVVIEEEEALQLRPRRGPREPPVGRDLGVGEELDRHALTTGRPPRESRGQATASTGITRRG